MKVVVIAAVDEKGGFSKQGKIPWYYKSDFLHFKEQTTNHICIMGRKTYEDINERLKNPISVLPNRECYVLSTSLKSLPNASVISSLYDIKPNSLEKTVFLIGGMQLFNIGINNKYADELWITYIPGDYKCDLFISLPKINEYYNQISSYTNNEDLIFTKYICKDILK